VPKSEQSSGLFFSAHEAQFSLHIPQCKKNWVCASQSKVHYIKIVPRECLIVSKKRRWRSLTIIISPWSSFGFLSFLYVRMYVQGALMWARYLSDFFYFLGLSRQQENLLLEPICRHVSARDVLSRNRQQHKTISELNIYIGVIFLFTRLMITINEFLMLVLFCCRN
jgi:hypothetical protein